MLAILLDKQMTLMTSVKGQCDCHSASLLRGRAEAARFGKRQQGLSQSKPESGLNTLLVCGCREYNAAAGLSRLILQRERGEPGRGKIQLWRREGRLMERRQSAG